MHLVVSQFVNILEEAAKREEEAAAVWESIERSRRFEGNEKFTDSPHEKARERRDRAKHIHADIQGWRREDLCEST